MSGNKDKFVIRHMQYGKSTNQAILLFKEYVEKYLGKDIKIEIVDFEKIKELEDENTKTKAELEKSRELIREMYRPLKEYSILIRGFEVHKGISKSEILSIKEIAKAFLKIKEGE